MDNENPDEVEEDDRSELELIKERTADLMNLQASELNYYIKSTNTYKKLKNLDNIKENELCNCSLTVDLPPNALDKIPDETIAELLLCYGINIYRLSVEQTVATINLNRLNERAHSRFTFLIMRKLQALLENPNQNTLALPSP